MARAYQSGAIKTLYWVHISEWLTVISCSRLAVKQTCDLQSEQSLSSLEIWGHTVSGSEHNLAHCQPASTAATAIYAFNINIDNRFLSVFLECCTFHLVQISFANILKCPASNQAYWSNVSVKVNVCCVVDDCMFLWCGRDNYKIKI